jgi:hypothetical protein
MSVIESAQRRDNDSGKNKTLAELGAVIDIQLSSPQSTRIESSIFTTPNVLVSLPVCSSLSCVISKINVRCIQCRI